MKRFLLGSLALLIVMVLTACGGGGAAVGPASQDLIPPTANLIAQVQVAKILDDIAISSLFDEAPKDSGNPQTLEELLDQAEAESGVDFRQFTTAVIFGDITQDNDYFGVIAEGQLDQGQLIAAIKESGGMDLSLMEHSGVQIQFDADDNTAFAFLEGDKMVIGTLPAVQDVVDVQQGNLAGVSGRLYDTFTELGSPLGSIAVAVPPEALEELQDSQGGGAGFGMMPAMEAIQDIQIIAFIIDRLGQDLKVEARLDFANADSAAEMGDTLDGLLKLMSGFISDENVTALLDKLELEVSGTMITVKLQAPLVEIQEAANSMEENLGGFY